MPQTFQIQGMGSPGVQPDLESCGSTLPLPPTESRQLPLCPISKIPCPSYIHTHDFWGHVSKPESKLIVPTTEEREMERTPGQDTQVPAFLILLLCVRESPFSSFQFSRGRWNLRFQKSFHPRHLGSSVVFVETLAVASRGRGWGRSGAGKCFSL